MKRTVVFLIAASMLGFSAAYAATSLPESFTAKDLAALFQQAGFSLTNVDAQMFGGFKAEVDTIGIEVNAEQNGGRSLDKMLNSAMANGSMNCAAGSYKADIVARRTLSGSSAEWWKSAACKGLGGGSPVTGGVIIADDTRHEKFTFYAGGNDDSKLSALGQSIFDALVKNYQ
jgi:hypothetical protein